MKFNGLFGVIKGKKFGTFSREFKSDRNTANRFSVIDFALWWEI